MGAAIFYPIDAVALLRAVLAEHCPSDAVAEEILAAAEAIGIDPLDHADLALCMPRLAVLRLEPVAWLYIRRFFLPERVYAGNRANRLRHGTGRYRRLRNAGVCKR